MANTKAETQFPVRGAMAGRLPEDDWELHPDVLRAWAAAQRAIETDRLREAAQAEREAGDRDGERAERAARRKRRWDAIRAKAGAAADGG